jgi:RecA/RadA recombinase
MAAEAVVAAQTAGFEIIYWDSELKSDPARISLLGGNPDKVFWIKTNEIRKGGQLVKEYIKALKEDNVDCRILVVWDSVGASMSRSETERNLSDEKHNVPGADAKENGSVIRHLVGQFNLYPNSICLFLVNQTYAKIGFMQHGEQAKGGSAIEYFSSLIVGLKRIKVLTKTEKGKKVKTGIITRATIVKNHLSQGKTSVYQADFTITANGSAPSEEEIEDEDD